MRQPTPSEVAEARNAQVQQELARKLAEDEQAERERIEQLRNSYRSGEPTSAMSFSTARLQWLHELANGGYRTPGDRIIPSFDTGEHASCVAATKEAVMAVLEPLIAQAEREYAAAEEERERIIRGR
jgi:hypothetical protein